MFEKLLVGLIIGGSISIVVVLLSIYQNKNRENIRWIIYSTPLILIPLFTVLSVIRGYSYLEAGVATLLLIPVVLAVSILANITGRDCESVSVMNYDRECSWSVINTIMTTVMTLTYSTLVYLLILKKLI